MAYLLPQRIRTQKKVVELEELLADGGYSSGEALLYLHQKKINAYIPNFGQYKSEREGFMFPSHDIPTKSYQIRQPHKE